MKKTRRSPAPLRIALLAALAEEILSVSSALRSLTAMTERAQPWFAEARTDGSTSFFPPTCDAEAAARPVGA